LLERLERRVEQLFGILHLPFAQQLFELRTLGLEVRHVPAVLLPLLGEFLRLVHLLLDADHLPLDLRKLGLLGGRALVLDADHPPELGALGIALQVHHLTRNSCAICGACCAWGLRAFPGSAPNPNESAVCRAAAAVARDLLFASTRLLIESEPVMDRKEKTTETQIDLEQIARRIRELSEIAAQQHLEALARSQADRLFRLVSTTHTRPVGMWR